MTYPDDDTQRALTPAERRRMEAELATLERELPELERICQEALADYHAAPPRSVAEDAAWRRYEERADVCDDARARAADLRLRLAIDEQAAIVASHGPEVRR